MNAKNTINKAQLAALTGATSAKVKRNAQPQYRLVKKQCERRGCPVTFDSYPGSYHPCCSTSCFALSDNCSPEFAATLLEHIGWIGSQPEPVEETDTAILNGIFMAQLRIRSQQS